MVYYSGYGSIPEEDFFGIAQLEIMAKSNSIVEIQSEVSASRTGRYNGHFESNKRHGRGLYISDEVMDQTKFMSTHVFQRSMFRAGAIMGHGCVTFETESEP
jgi:hypothetical protein